MYAVRDLMRTDVLTLGDDDTLGAADSLLSLRTIRHMPVLREGRVVGVVTYRDLLETCLERGCRPDDVRAREVMTADPVTVHPGTALRNAARLLMDEKIGCVPVVDAAGRFVGLLTEADFVRFALEIVTDFDHAADGLAAEDRAAP